MYNPKETYDEKLQKDKLHYNKYKKKANKFTNNNYENSVVNTYSAMLKACKDLPQEERVRIINVLEKAKVKAYKKNYKEIANRIKYRDNRDDKEK